MHVPHASGTVLFPPLRNSQKRSVHGASMLVLSVCWDEHRMDSFQGINSAASSWEGAYIMSVAQELVRVQIRLHVVREGTLL